VVRATDSAITHVHGLPLTAPPTPAWEKLTTNNYKIPTTNNVANDSLAEQESKKMDGLGNGRLRLHFHIFLSHTQLMQRAVRNEVAAWPSVSSLPKPDRNEAPSEAAVKSDSGARALDMK
jgi:hypothetical protein